MSDACGGLEYAPTPARDPGFQAWRQRLSTLPPGEVQLRGASETTQDGRRIADLQVACSPIIVRRVRENVSMIAGRSVQLAKVDGVHVGLCVSKPGPLRADPLPIQLVGVVAEALRRGIGLALVSADAALEPSGNLALATHDSNAAARALNERLAASINARLVRVRVGTQTSQ